MYLRLCCCIKISLGRAVITFWKKVAPVHVYFNDVADMVKNLNLTLIMIFRQNVSHCGLNVYIFGSKIPMQTNTLK